MCIRDRVTKYHIYDVLEHIVYMVLRHLGAAFHGHKLRQHEGQYLSLIHISLYWHYNHRLGELAAAWRPGRLRGGAEFAPTRKT